MTKEEDAALAAEIDALSPAFEIDGTEHERGDDCWCRPEKHCPKCGAGWLHPQGIYGGLIHQCDTCDYCR